MAGDLSLSGHTLTAKGDVQFSGEEIIFNGSNAYLSAPDHANWQFDGDFTVELFGVKFDAAGLANVQDLISHFDDSGDQRGWRVRHAGTFSPKLLQFIRSTDGTTGTQANVAADFEPTADQAYNICVERSGSTVRIYVDGAMLNSGTLSGTTFNSSAALTIGARLNVGAGADFFDGRLKAVRITKGAARYASDGGYTVPTLPLPTS